MSITINSIVFDVGWVLVRLDYSPLTTYLQEHGDTSAGPFLAMNYSATWPGWGTGR